MANRKLSESRASKVEDQAQIYYQARKDADRALAAKNYAQSRAEYLKGVKNIDAAKDKENYLCALYAGAGNAARCQGKYITSLRDFQKSANHLQSGKLFMAMLTYIIEYLIDMTTYINSDAQRRIVKSVAQQLTKKYAGWLNSEAPQAKPKTYRLNKKRVADAFATLEELAEFQDPDSVKKRSEATDWLQKQALLARLRLLPIILDFKRPKEFYKAGYAQMHQIPYKAGDYYFYSNTDRSSYKTIKRSVTIGKKAKTIFSAKQHCPVGTWLAGTRVHRNGKLLAYGLSKYGSDFQSWKIIDLTNGKELKDVIENVPSGSIFFHPTKRGLYYRKNFSKKAKGKEAEYNKRAAIFYHHLGQSPERDTLIHAPHSKDADWVDVYPLINTDFVIVSEVPSQSFHNRIFVKSLVTEKMVRLFDRCIGSYAFLGKANDKLFFRTDHRACRGRVISVSFDWKKHRIISTKEALPESELALQDVRLLEDSLIVHALDAKGHTRLMQYDLAGALIGEIQLPFSGTLSALSTSFRDKNLFFTLQNFATPSTIYHHNLETGQTKLFQAPTYSMAKRVEQHLVQVKSKDGTMIPMNIAHLKGIKLDGKNPTLLYVYGGFSISMFPYFSYQIASWLAMGGIWAQPYLRGGDELGSDWHESATKLNKQKTYDDTAASARWLIENKYTRPDKLAINGASNGGLTVGVAITQHPELYGAAIADNGLYDMLKFSLHGLGWAWQAEYGSINKAEELKTLEKYSPYHQLGKVKKAKHFPKVMINAAACDDRVVPWHSYKFAAALQSELNADVMLNVKYKQGHGAGKPDWTIRDNLAYLKWALKF